MSSTLTTLHQVCAFATSCSKCKCFSYVWTQYYSLVNWLLESPAVNSHMLLSTVAQNHLVKINSCFFCVFFLQTMNPPVILNRTRVCYQPLELKCVACVVVLATKPAPAATLWPTVENTTRPSTGNTHTRRIVAAKVCVAFSSIFYLQLLSVGYNFCVYTLMVEWSNTKTS